ncbi:MobC family plasmid mobilization relaxosome protein [Mucilaginibacter rubeus]|uniref:MobC family plasmid mobilization relaxosome protein n=2 Tax=Mucilaginibacter rubeus TaxID=2027860 RepID=A0AAE6MH37_9SPHI|nr:MobC family plasmid mobilization relaxosome protein [Mucilaginibacter rubeus]QEM15760.1 MobC family plasmid mobilization relaxosome protein [Mucilaginibacter gossypii]
MSLCFWYPKTPPAPTAGRQTCFLLPMVAKRFKELLGFLKTGIMMSQDLKATAKQETEQPKRKGGRPKSRVRRETHVKVRLTATEHFMIGSKAREAGMRVSDWIRAAAKSARVVARLKPEDLQLMRMLSGLANNLNQLTKLAHRDGILSIARKADSTLTEIFDALKYFNSHDRQDT